MFDLAGQKALVTGASGGIGGAIARALYAQGAAVMLAGTREAALTALAAKLGDRAHILTADLSQPSESERLIRETEAALGGLDILSTMPASRATAWRCVCATRLADGARDQPHRRIPPDSRRAAACCAGAMAGLFLLPRWLALPAIQVRRIMPRQKPV